MSAHDVYVVIRGKGLNKYEENLKEILNKGFEYDWYFGDEVYVDENEITINEQTKNCDFDKLINAVKKGIPEAEEIYYHVEPYWKANRLDEDSCDDEFAYWTNNKEYRKTMFPDARNSKMHFVPSVKVIQESFDEARESLSEEESDWAETEAYYKLCDKIYNCIMVNHTYPYGFNWCK